MVRLRKSDLRDIKNMLQLYENVVCTNSTLLDSINEYTVYEENDEVLGSARSTINDAKVYIYCLYTEKKHRRKKIASAVIRTILNSALNNNAKTAYLHTTCSDFAEFMGFCEITLSDETEIQNHFGSCVEISNAKIYKVELEGYFKPCCMI